MKPWDARIANLLVRPLRNGFVHPNHVTTISLLLGLCAAGLAARGGGWLHWAALLLMLSMLVDHADGELARMTGKSSEFGHRYDVTSDAIVKVLFFVGLGLGLRDSTLGALAPWMGACAGVSIAAVFYLWQQAEGALGKNVVVQASWSGFETEDVLYLIGPVAWFGGASIFMICAAIGAPVFALWFFRKHRAQVEAATTGRESRE